MKSKPFHGIPDVDGGSSSSSSTSSTTPTNKGRHVLDPISTFEELRTTKAGSGSSADDDVIEDGHCSGDQETPTKPSKGKDREKDIRMVDEKHAWSGRD